MREGQENARGAVSLSVAEKYVEAFGNLAKQGTAVVVPGNVGDIGGMIASAMAVYGKVSESQSQAQKGIMDTSYSGVSEGQKEQGSKDHTMGKTDEVATSVLQSFDGTMKK
ncbi:MAG: hypothetical protein L6R42_011233, partial [Xanthoria sp. 1 TBL-2021]